MSARVIRPVRDPLESLERMLNRTTLTTQRVQHTQIIKLGGRMLEVKADDTTAERDKAIQIAVEAAETRATRELRAALKRLKQHKDAERLRALEKQKEYFERHYQRISDNRDKAEEERFRELTKKFLKEKKEALEKQAKALEEEKTVAVAKACELLTEKLRKDYIVDRDSAVKEALIGAEEIYKQREAALITKAKLECEEKVRLKTVSMQTLHDAAIDKERKRYVFLHDIYKKELVRRIKIETDFKKLQEDYKRFIDNTDGRFHSDYLMRLRYVRNDLSEMAARVVGYDDIIRLEDWPDVVS